MSDDDQPAIEAISTREVTGHTIHLDDNRFVFVGEHPDKPDSIFIGFRSKDRKELRIAISREAANALNDLLTPNTTRGLEPRAPMPSQPQWRVVIRPHTRTRAAIRDADTPATPTATSDAETSDAE